MTPLPLKKCNLDNINQIKMGCVRCGNPLAPWLGSRGHKGSAPEKYVL